MRTLRLSVLCSHSWETSRARSQARYQVSSRPHHLSVRPPRSLLKGELPDARGNRHPSRADLSVSWAISQVRTPSGGQRAKAREARSPAPEPDSSLCQGFYSLVYSSTHSTNIFRCLLLLAPGIGTGAKTDTMAALATLTVYPGEQKREPSLVGQVGGRTVVEEWVGRRQTRSGGPSEP